MKFSGKNVIVTGASGGMGVILCERLAKSGANLALCSNDAEKLSLLAQDLRKKYGVKIVSCALDITDEKEAKEFINKAYGELGKFKALVNLAGLSIPNNYAETDTEVFEKIMNVNIKGSFLACKHFEKYADDNALIVNTGSMAARNTNANAPVYCMAKSAVNKLSEGLLLQYAKKNIRVTTVNPGGADTPFWGTRSVDRSKLMKAEDVVDVFWFVLNMSDNVQIHSIVFESICKFN